MTEPVSQPIFFVVDEDPSAVEALGSDLERRFSADYRVMGETSAAAALERLGALREAGEQVALIFCYESMRAMPGSELLASTDGYSPAYVVKKRAEVTGEMLVDAQPRFDQQTGRPVRSGTDDDPVGMQEIPDCGSLAEKLRIRGHVELDTGFDMLSHGALDPLPRLHG